MDCIVVGGGLLGMLSALQLAEEGLSVALLEQGEPCRESSWAGGGIISPLVPWDYPDAVSVLVSWSQQHYPRLVERLHEETGIDPEWTRSGLLSPGCRCSKTIAAWHARFPCVLDELDADRLRQEEPGIGGSFDSGLLLPDVAHIRNPRMGQALVRALELQGVAVHSHTRVTGLRLKAGRILGVETENGRFTACRVVIAGGAWSGHILEGYGPDIPVQPVLGQMILFKAVPGLLRHIIVHDGYYLIPRRDGLVLAGSTLEHTGFRKQVTEDARELLTEKAIGLLPGLSDFPVVRHWAGLRPGKMDGIPLIGRFPGVVGLYINAGHYRNGVGMAPASARLLADSILGRASFTDAGPYALQLPE